VSRGASAGKQPPGVHRLRIGLVYDARYPNHHGGAERRYHEIASRLAGMHHVEYITWGSPADSTAAANAGYRVRSVGVAPPLYGADGKRTIREAVSFAARILPTLVRGRYDVIDCSATPYVPLYACWLASRLSGTPLVVTWHEFWGDHWLSYLPQRPLVGRVARRLEDSGRRIGDRLIPVSAYTARRMGVSEGDPRVRIVGNGVAIDAIQAAPRQPKVDVIYLGRLIDEKRVDLLLHAIAGLGRHRPSVSGLIVGEGPERAGLEGLSASLGLGNRVRFTGSLDTAQVFGHLKSARVMVLPSIREGFAIAVLEAQAAGAVPIVVRSPASAAPDLIRDGVDGLLCEPTAESISGSIDQLLADPARRTAMARQARQAARQYDWAHVADQMEAVYREAAAHKEPIKRQRRVSPSCP